ncbi:MAG: ABC transporter substrate-binding protein [Deltaproteobacteria bacterium]|nr:ABC transporter substrate-binding protein [Deltaproteobacteria bacterium]
MRYRQTRMAEWVDGLSLRRKVLMLSLAWLALISASHFWVNREPTGRIVVRMGYMPVISNIAAPILDAASKEGKGVRFEAMKFSSFAEMGEALRNGSIDAAFIIAPLAVALRQQGEDVRIVAIGARHESTLVVKKSLPVKTFADLAGKTLAVPMRFSGHNLAVRRLAEKYGLGESIKIVEMNPPDMAAAMAAGVLDAYCVGEPMAAKTIMAGQSRALSYVEEAWPGFICNLVLVKGDLVENHPERVAALVQGAARAGLWAKANLKEAARIASDYWGTPLPLVEYALETPPGRVVFNRFAPKESEVQEMAGYMARFRIIETAEIEGLVEPRFALAADLDGIKGFSSILRKARGR